MNVNDFLGGQVMSTIEFSRITGKEHFHVLRDTELMFERLGLMAVQFWMVNNYVSGKGGVMQQPYYSLPKNLTLTLAGGYSVPIRHQIILRWELMERTALQKTSLPQLSTWMGAEWTFTSRVPDYTLDLEAILLRTTPYARPMSTLEIAVVTEKRHDNVLRDTRSMLSQLNIDETPFRGIETYINKGVLRQRPVLNLPRELALTMVTGYDVRELYAIVNRWLDLMDDKSVEDAVFAQFKADKVQIELSF